MPYRNLTVREARVVAGRYAYRFPPQSYSPAAWDTDLANYASAAGLEAVAAVPAGALEIGRAHV